jgi:hypothetical protein
MITDWKTTECAIGRKKSLNGTHPARLTTIKKYKT